MKFAFFGSSLVSAYWNGAATYYRGLIRQLHERGHEVVFYEPDAYERQKHRDIEDPSYARSVVYSADGESGVLHALLDAQSADVVIKASGVGVFDALLEEEILFLRRPGNLVIFWDVDAPATLERLSNNSSDPFRRLVPEYDMILTFGGGEPVIDGYGTFNAKCCFPIYNALDSDTHHPVDPDQRFHADISFLGNRIPDREDRVHEFFFRPAEMKPQRDFLIAGNGWNGEFKSLPNVRCLGHVYTQDHNAFNSTPRFVLNINRESMAGCGYSPATRIFEAAGAGACLITDEWKGIEMFLEPGRECLVAPDAQSVAGFLDSITDEQAKRIGAAALKRIRSDHTYSQRATQLESIIHQVWPTRVRI